MTIAITGATGQLGRHVIGKLKQKTGADGIVALVRSLDKAQDLGVEARVADYTQPATLEAALAGVDTLLLICLLYTSPSPRDLSTSRMPSSA